MISLSNPNSPNFDPIGWVATQARLAIQNRTSMLFSAARSLKGKPLSSTRKLTTREVGGSVNALRSARFDAKVESAKVVNREPDAKAARALGLTLLSVKGLRAECKRKGLKRYSKAKRADLLAMLA